MKKILALIVTVCLCVSLTGCMAVVQEFTIQEDGSGTITVAMGYTEEGWQLLQQMEQMEQEQGEPVSEINLEDYTAFQYNGVTYYGEVAQESFDSLTALNQNSAIQDVGIFAFSENEDGDIVLTMTVSEQAEEEPVAEEDAMTEEMLESMVVVYQFNFPYPVVQTAGPAHGVTITDNQLKLDCMAIDQNGESGTIYTFVSGKSANTIQFDDVKQDDWFCPAVMSLAKGGLVLGVSDNLFDPEGTLTYAQFCQILARAKNLKTGEANGYWAYDAIDSCVKEGYIISLGEITEENYDVAIPRQAAVSGMYLAKKDSLANPINLSNADIPDYEEISAEYKDNVLAAYQFGITKGVDEIGTFLPQRSLTRAEICQLFYNLNWVSAQ